jgi:hypothetical protein
MNRFGIAGIAVVLGAAALVSAFLLRSTHAPARRATVTFSSFTAEQLAKAGIRLTAPRGASSPAAGRAANAAARKEMGLPVRESHFVHCADTRKVHKLDQGCWVVSLNTTDFVPPGGITPIMPGGRPQAKRMPLKYWVVLVEPGTNKILDSQGGTPPKAG